MSPVSVIVPVHDGERFLHEALAAIVYQTHSDIELILVDDSSDDDSAEIAAAFDPEKSGSDDFDWLLRARHAGLVVAVLSEVLVRRRLHDGNVSHDAARMRSGLFGILRDLVRDEQAPS